MHKFCVAHSINIECVINCPSLPPFVEEITLISSSECSDSSITEDEAKQVHCKQH